MSSAAIYSARLTTTCIVPKGRTFETFCSTFPTGGESEPGERIRGYFFNRCNTP